MTHTLAQIESLFTVPGLAAAGAAAAAVPIAIHLLWRLRRQPRAWGAMRFLQAAYRRHRQRLRFEQLLLLLVRCLILIVLGLALAGPVLTGAAAAWVGGLDTGGRVVHILIDDALPTQTLDATGERRFDQLKARAAALVDELQAGDRAALWRTARPADAVIAEPTADRAALRRALNALQPRFSRPATVEALRQVRTAMREAGDATARHTVVVLSPFGEASTFLDEPVPTALSDLGEHAELWATPPAEDAANVQIADLTPRRRMVLTAEASAAVPVRVALRRFERELAAGSATLTLALRESAGRVHQRVQRNVRFEAGQQRAMVNISLPVQADRLDLEAGARLLVLEARVDVGDALNQLEPDDRRWAVVELRPRLNVGVMDEAIEAEDAEALRPGDWLRLALDPQSGASPSAVRVAQVRAADVREQALASLDAVLVLRPDLLANDAWDRLAGFAQDGGLVWVFTPPMVTPAVWTRGMQRAFELDWRIGLDPTAADERGAPLDGDSEAPEVLPLLASDWSMLLGPVRVNRWLAMDVPAEAVWLRTRGGEAVLAHASVGAGALLFQGHALHTDWTNLPTKPLFVPLVHEALRGVLGVARSRIEPNVVAGDAPTFGAAWREVQRLQHIGGDTTLALQRNEAGVQAGRAIDQPGIYAADEREGALKLAVNVEADAGDTRGVTEERVTAWLGGLGGGRLLDDSKGPGVVLDRATAAFDLGWPLLWVVMALLLLETALARWLSHARRSEVGGLGGRRFGSLASLGRARREAAREERAA